MQIVATDSGELSNFEYHVVEEGRIYHAPGRVVIVDPTTERAILIELDQEMKL